MFIIFVFLVSDVIAPPPVSIEGVHWEMDGTKWACRVGGCDASYITECNLVQHLQSHHNVVMELGKPECPSTWEEASSDQNHVAMNALVLSNHMAQFYHNEKKAITRAKRHVNLDWDKL